MACTGGSAVTASGQSRRSGRAHWWRHLVGTGRSHIVTGVARGPAAGTPHPWPDPNLGFERASDGHPTGWASRTSYEWAAVSDARHGGERSVRLCSAGTSGFGAVMARLRRVHEVA
jgi:hypothetical protein